MPRATSCCCPSTSNTSAPGKAHRNSTVTGPYCSVPVASEGNIEGPFVSNQDKCALEVKRGNLDEVAAFREFLGNHPWNTSYRLAHPPLLESFTQYTDQLIGGILWRRNPHRYSWWWHSGKDEFNRWIRYVRLLNVPLSLLLFSHKIFHVIDKIVAEALACDRAIDVCSRALEPRHQSRCKDAARHTVERFLSGVESPFRRKRE